MQDALLKETYGFYINTYGNFIRRMKTIFLSFIPSVWISKYCLIHGNTKESAKMHYKEFLFMKLLKPP